MTRPLEGIRIVDLSMGWAGPLACRHMADMGADVIKIESCERFDWWRSWEATPEWIADDGAEKSSAFNMVNRNKRSVTLDLERPDGRRLLLDLVRMSHAVVENFSSGVMRKLELSHEVLESVREGVVLLAMPAFGSTGPWAEFRAYGSTVEQSSGLPHLNGLPEDPPTMQHVAYGDAVGGLTGASALLTALRHQARTGQGQFVDLSQVEALHALGIHGILEHGITGASFSRLGNRSRRFAPHGVFPGAPALTPEGEDADEWIVIQVFREAQWHALRDLAAPALDGFGDLEDRLARTDELEAALAGWTRQHRARPLMHRLQSAGVPAAATNSAASLLEDEQLDARGFWQYLERAVVGLQPNPSAPYRSGAQPITIAAPAPTLGQHNEEVLMGMLGLSRADMTRLTELGVIGTRPRMPKER